METTVAYLKREVTWARRKCKTGTMWYYLTQHLWTVWFVIQCTLYAYQNCSVHLLPRAIWCFELFQDRLSR